jgi:DNA-binding XRE family transcriptional regulator
VTNWELGRTAPALVFMPRIIRFLGYSPFGASDDLPERLIAHRQTHGLSQSALAALLAVDPSTVANWERGTARPNEANSATIRDLLERPPRRGPGARR